MAPSDFAAEVSGEHGGHGCSICWNELGSEETVGAALGDELCAADLEEFLRDLGCEVGVLACCDSKIPSELEDVACRDHRNVRPGERESCGESDWPFHGPFGVEFDDHRRAWRALYKTYWALLPIMEQDLREQAGVDVATYNALSHTYLEGPDGLRMKDLARNASLSTPGLTSLVGRLEKQGLVQRNPDPQDRRATRITLTDQGLELTRQAAHVHIASIEKHFASRVSDSDATAIAETLEHVEHDINTTAPNQ